MGNENMQHLHNEIEKKKKFLIQEIQNLSKHNLSSKVRNCVKDLG